MKSSFALTLALSFRFVLLSYLFKQLTIQFNYTSKIETKIQWKMKTFDSKNSNDAESERGWGHTHTHTYISLA